MLASIPAWHKSLEALGVPAVGSESSKTLKTSSIVQADSLEKIGMSGFHFAYDRQEQRDDVRWICERLLVVNTRATFEKNIIQEARLSLQNLGTDFAGFGGVVSSPAL